MLRKTIVVPLLLMCCCCLLLTAGGCNKNKDAQADRQREAAKEQANAERLAPQNQFEASQDPPLTADTRFAAGQLAESQGNFDNAIVQYREALKVDPDHRHAMFRLGGVYTQTRRFADAIATWERYLKLTGDAPEGYNNLALSYKAAGRLQDAEQTFRAGIAKDPDNQPCRLNYGLMLAERGRVEEAIAQLSVVLPPAAVQYNLGAICEQQGLTEEAKTHYRKALELDPKLRDARSRLAVLK